MGFAEEGDARWCAEPKDVWAWRKMDPACVELPDLAFWRNRRFGNGMCLDDGAAEPNAEPPPDVDDNLTRDRWPKVWRLLGYGALAKQGGKRGAVQFPPGTTLIFELAMPDQASSSRSWRRARSVRVACAFLMGNLLVCDEMRASSRGHPHATLTTHGRYVRRSATK